MSDINDEHIDALVHHLDNDYWPEKHRALTALVAERDALKQRVEELDALKQRIASRSAIKAVSAERDALRKRVAELEAQPPAVRDRELRERLVESALQGAGALSMLDEDTAKFLGRQAVWMVDGAIAEMRKGEADGK
jgi:uncharacterized coiled-coil DUF342 family protein